jgi:uracil-DNA glycosylase family 4
VNKVKQDALAKIAREIEDCRICRQWGKGKAVPGEGNAGARIVFVGEAPGNKEAETGRPFVGRSGKFLRERIREIGLSEEEVFITSPVHYLPVSKTPSKENILHSRTHLLKQLSVINPEIIVLLGNTACLALLDKRPELVKEHGQVVRKNGKTFLLTFHPAYAIRFPSGKKGVLSDFEQLKNLIR